MIKTLRITSILAVLAASVFFVFPVFFGVRPDAAAEKFLSSAAVIEQFKETAGKSSTKPDSQNSPLVKQAEAFALYLNPPVKAEPRIVNRSTHQSEPRPAVVSAKFELIGTSFYASNPELSLALIDQPGKGLRWIRQASEIGHLVVEQINDGFVVVRDGQRTYQLQTERPETRSLLKGETSKGKYSSETVSRVETGRFGADFSEKAERKNNEPGPGLDESEPGLSGPEAALMEKFIEELRSVQTQVESNDVDSGNADDKSRALMDKLQADLRSVRMSDDEAERLSDLGEKLKAGGIDPNRISRRARVRSLRKHSVDDNKR